MKEEQAQHTTHATSNLGIWLNWKMVLYLKRFGKSENKALFNPKLRVARERYWLVMPKLRR